MEISRTGNKFHAWVDDGVRNKRNARRRPTVEGWMEGHGEEGARLPGVDGKIGPTSRPPARIGRNTGLL